MECPEKPTIKLDSTDLSALRLTSSAANGNQWFVNGTPILNETNQVLLVTAPGSYTVQVSFEGCQTVMSNAVLVLVTGIDRALADQGIGFFPNPVKQIALISLEALIKDKPVTLEIFDMKGTNVKLFESVGGAVESLDLSFCKSGMHLLRASQAGRYYYLKFMKE
jgi:hypothetical protein